MKPESIDATIVLCTYNRAKLLSNTLNSLVALDSSKYRWELLVVDNNSQDSTASVIEDFRTQLPLHALHESRQGKCHALNLALTQAKGSLLLFLDDDIVVPPNWLNSYIDADRLHAFDWYGGRVKPAWAEKPRWFREETAENFDGYFGNYDLGLTSHAYNSDEKLPLGASMACHRKVFNAVGEFRIDLGPRGNLRGVGDETDLLLRAIADGFEGYYIGGNAVQHHVGKERLALSGFINYGIGKGINQARMQVSSKQRNGSILIMVSQSLRGLVQFVRGRGDRFRVCLINIGIEIGMRRA